MDSEAQLLASLGITDPSIQNDIMSGAARLLILDVSAHLDWDWLLPFSVLSQGGTGVRAQGYFTPATGPADTIFTQAAALLADPAYHFSICEMSFLRAFADAQPANFATLSANTATNKNLRIAGGGITSPDNLLTHGEAFIRAYLLGHHWLAQNLDGPPPPVSVWLPDDFGHDPNLPIIVQAMGLSAAGFARIPGTGTSPKQTVSGGDSMSTILSSGPIDFTWTAPDGSSILAHWMIGGTYTQGSGMSSRANIESYLNTNAGPSPTPYIYVPVMNDFALPNTAITGLIQQNSPMAWNGETVYLAAGAFEDYAQLVSFHPLTSTAFNPNPYYTGCYGSRPAQKILHQRAVRTLLAAEVFSIIASFAQKLGTTASLATGASTADLFLDAWNLVAPSTHHDYITGTAIPDVYHREQQLLLREAARRAEWLLGDAMQTIAASIHTTSYQAVAVFNPLAFSRTEVVEVQAGALKNFNIPVHESAGYQYTAGGSLLFLGTAPSMGYQVNDLNLASAPLNPVNPVTVTRSSDTVVLSNGLVQATLSLLNDENDWYLASCIDLKGNTELIAAGQKANDLLFYLDSGNEYHFGMETAGWTLTDVQSKLSNPRISVVEQGPLRVHVITAMTYTDRNGSIDYVREYFLYANEPMLRMRTTGAAPMLGEVGSSVVAAFPLAAGANGITSLQRGTPYHWTEAAPSAIYWNSQTFLPTHNFVLPFAGGSSPLCAIYHSDVPAWGLSYHYRNGAFDPNDGQLYGCLFRNGNGSYFNWVADHGTYTPYGTDPGVHVHDYALRVPSGLGDVSTGAPLCESLAFAFPMRALPLEPIQSVLPANLSLVSSSPNALVRVAKFGTVDPSEVVLRVYTPGTTPGSPSTVNLTISNLLGNGVTVTGLNALEQPLAGDGNLNLLSSGDTISFTANTALTTLGFTP